MRGAILNMDVTILSPYYLDQRRNRDVYGLEDRAEHIVDIPLAADDSLQERVAAICAALAIDFDDAVRRGGRPGVLAGDCCATIGVLAGLQRAGLDPALIWFDAHGDFNTWETTPSGFLGGMPLAMVVGRGEQTLLEGTGMQPLSEEKVILTDARDLDPQERELVNASSILHLTRIDSLMKDDVLPTGPLYIHFDCDVIEPALAPAMNYPAPGGPLPSELDAVFTKLVQTGRVVAVSVSLWEPRLDGGGQTRRITLNLLDTLLSG